MLNRFGMRIFQYFIDNSGEDVNRKNCWLEKARVKEEEISEEELLCGET